MAINYFVHIVDPFLFSTIIFHFQFAITTSRVLRLKIGSKVTDNELEVEGYQVIKICYRKRKIQTVLQYYYLQFGSRGLVIDILRVQIPSKNDS